jgi:hypothetical protein
MSAKAPINVAIKGKEEGESKSVLELLEEDDEFEVSQVNEMIHKHWNFYCEFGANSQPLHTLTLTIINLNPNPNNY